MFSVRKTYLAVATASESTTTEVAYNTNGWRTSGYLL